jgi:hypothetical protein
MTFGYFFLHYLCTNAVLISYFVLSLRFRLPKIGNHLDDALAVFNCNAHKVIKDAISYARIQANNQYYKEIVLQKNEHGGGLCIYLLDRGAILSCKEFYVF